MLILPYGEFCHYVVLLEVDHDFQLKYSYGLVGKHLNIF
jgi:hypothetical protein